MLPRYMLALLCVSTMMTAQHGQLMPFSPHTVILHHSDKDGFNLHKEGTLIPLQRCFMDKELRGISNEKLSRLLTSGAYLKVTKMDNTNDYALHLNGRLLGGGPIIGKAAHWTVKIGGHIGFGILCFFHPAHVAEYPHVKEAIDAAAQVAEVVGTVTPGP